MLSTPTLSALLAWLRGEEPPRRGRGLAGGRRAWRTAGTAATRRGGGWPGGGLQAAAEAAGSRRAVTWPT